MSVSERDLELQAAREKNVSWLVSKTGITVPQAHELIDLLGTGSPSSLLREALLLKK